MMHLRSVSLNKINNTKTFSADFKNKAINKINRSHVLSVTRRLLLFTVRVYMHFKNGNVWCFIAHPLPTLDYMQLQDGVIFRQFSHD